MNQYIEYMISEYKKKEIVVDTNLLLLLLIGRYDIYLISKFKRTETYSIDDYRLLEKLISHFPGIITSPNILTEISNLSDGISQEYFSTFAKQIKTFNEQTIPSSNISEEPIFIKLGLTDAGISMFAKNRHLIVTVDLPLANFLETSGLPVINFNHLRFPI